MSSAENAELSRVFRQALSDFDSLDEEDLWTMYVLLEYVINVTEAAWKYYDKGVIDRVEVDGRPVRARPAHRTFIYHKPVGVICSFTHFSASGGVIFRWVGHSASTSTKAKPRPSTCSRSAL